MLYLITPALADKSEGAWGVCGMRRHLQLLSWTSVVEYLLAGGVAIQLIKDSASLVIFERYGCIFKNLDYAWLGRQLKVVNDYLFSVEPFKVIPHTHARKDFFKFKSVRGGLNLGMLSAPKFRILQSVGVDIADLSVQLCNISVLR